MNYYLAAGLLECLELHMACQQVGSTYEGIAISSKLVSTYSDPLIVLKLLLSTEFASDVRKLRNAVCPAKVENKSKSPARKSHTRQNTCSITAHSIN